jgi:replication factor A1
LIIGDETGEILVNFWNEKSSQAKDLKLGDIITVVGLSSKIGLKGLIELHSNRFTNFTKEDATADFVVKKGLVGTISKESIQISKLNEISDINQLISVKGLIIQVNPIHEFSRESGSKGKVQNIVISDASSLMRIVLWDDKTALIDSKDTDKMLSIINGNTRKGRFTDIEIHCGNQTQVDLEEVEINVIKQYQVTFTNLNDITPTETDVNVRGVITDFNLVQEITTKENETIKLQSFKLNDQTAEIKITCWRDNVQKLANLSGGEKIEIYQAKVKEDSGYGYELIITGNSFLKKAIHNDITPQ